MCVARERTGSLHHRCGKQPSPHPLAPLCAAYWLQSPVAVGITSTGARVPLYADDAARIAATANEYMLPPELENVIILQSTARSYGRILAADIALDVTPAGSHVVRTGIPPPRHCHCSGYPTRRKPHTCFSPHSPV